MSKRYSEIEKMVLISPVPIIKTILKVAYNNAYSGSEMFIEKQLSNVYPELKPELAEELSKWVLQNYSVGFQCTWNWFVKEFIMEKECK